jgi:hypothetical protein
VTRPGSAWAIAVGLALVTVTTAARAEGRPVDADARPPPDPDAWRLALFAGAGYLGSHAGSGAAFGTGVRWGLGSHLAASVDLGYGLLEASSTVQDRWWVIPSVAVVLPAGPVRFDLGAGAGVGTSSGYVSQSDYLARPFAPVWHYTVPAVRGHVTAAFALSPGLELFARADLASLVFSGSGAGSADTTWLALWVGVQPRLL